MCAGVYVCVCPCVQGYVGGGHRVIVSFFIALLFFGGCLVMELLGSAGLIPCSSQGCGFVLPRAVGYSQVLWLE